MRVLATWRDAAAKSRGNERPHLQYALLVSERGKHRDAIDAVSTAARINPFSSPIASVFRAVQSHEVRP